MNTRTKSGLEVLQVAVIVGVLGDVLLRQTPWGLNVLLFNLAFAAGMIMLLRRRAAEQVTANTLALFGALIFFASMFVWRDSIELRVADTFAIIAILSVLFLPRMKVVTQIAGVFHYAIAFLWSSLNAIFAPFVLVGSDVAWSNIPRDGWRRHVSAVLRGVALAAPLILIFGGLFMGADAAYEGLVKRAFDFVPETVFTHVLIFSAFAWLSAGYLRGVIINPLGVAAAAADTGSEPVAETSTTGESKVDTFRAESGEHPVTLPDNMTVVEHLNAPETPIAEPEAETRPAGSVPPTANNEPKKEWTWATLDNSLLPKAFTLGGVEVGIILGLMNLLFLSFVVVQVPYLFGGMELVQNTPDLKLADYARRGFGELVAVSALVLPTLLVGHWLIKKEASSAQKLFRVLAGTQIVLLFVIMASALQRLVLLTGNLGYGMTTVRLYPLIFMGWLAIVFVWFAGTVLRGTREYFAIGALWSAFFVLGATHVLNPDAFIVKTNLALMREGREFDGTYLSELSNDALPSLIDSFDHLSEADQQEAIPAIASKFCYLEKGKDLRSWNLSRERAWKVLSSNPEFVSALGDCQTSKVGFPRPMD
jgi:hypothetical protein